MGDELTPDEQLLASALKMNHEQAQSTVQESLKTNREEMSDDEESAFTHIYNCMRVECGEFWQKMRSEHSDPKSQEKLFKHIELADIIEKRLHQLLSRTSPPWPQEEPGIDY